MCYVCHHARLTSPVTKATGTRDLYTTLCFWEYFSGQYVWLHHIERVFCVIFQCILTVPPKTLVNDDRVYCPKRVNRLVTQSCLTGAVIVCSVISACLL